MKKLLFILLSLTAVAASAFDRAKMDSLFMLIEQHEKGMGCVAPGRFRYQMVGLELEFHGDGAMTLKQNGVFEFKKE